MINVPCIWPSIKLIATALANMPVIIHTMSIIWDSIWLWVRLLRSMWRWWSLLPYVYAQVNTNCHYYYPECHVETHTSTYGHTRAVFGDLYSVEKIGGLRFRCPGYFINHLVIPIPGPPSPTQKKFAVLSSVITPPSLHWNPHWPSPVLC